MMSFDGRLGFDDAPTTAIVVAEARRFLISESDGLLCATFRSQEPSMPRSHEAHEELTDQKFSSCVFVYFVSSWLDRSPPPVEFAAAGVCAPLAVERARIDQ